MKNKFAGKLLFLIVAVLSLILVMTTFVACKVDENKGDQTGDVTDPDGGGQTPSDTEYQIYLDEFSAPSATYLGYGSLNTNAGSDGNPLSLIVNGEEREFSHGLFAHAYSVVVYDNLETRGFIKFSAYVGANKTARVANTATNMVFRIIADNKEIWSSEEVGAYTDAQFVEVDITGVNRLALVADSLGGNGNDHAVWADCQLSYLNAIKPDLQIYDFEITSPSQVTASNLLSLARATSADGKDISNKIKYKTDYVAGTTGNFSVTYEVSDGNAVARKTVTMSVLRNNRFSVNASDDELTSPFANFLYYGRNVLSEENRKAYDLLLGKLLKVNISDSSVTSLTVNLQDNGIYLLKNEVLTIKRYLATDESRLYFIYYWNDWSEGSGATVTLKNGFVDTVTIRLYNGKGEYYYGQNNLEAYRTAEKEISGYLSDLSEDMTDAQLLFAAHNKYYSTINYANVNYADGFYGAFITKKCICSGYSMGYVYLAQRVGARVLYTNGYAGGAHAWNYVLADGGWYMSDTTWGGPGAFSLLGKNYMDENNRYDYGNYAVMPRLSDVRYDTALTAYPLITIDDEKILLLGEKFDVKSLVHAKSSVEDKAPITYVTYTGTINMSVSGTYPITVTAYNSLGNKAVKECVINVCKTTDKLSVITPVQNGNSNYAFREVSLYNGEEKVFSDGIYTKANGTLTLDFDVSGKGYRFFSAYVGIDKVIRDNDPWGVYANATVRVLADGKELYKKGGIGWKTDMNYICVELPHETKLLRLEISDTSGQGGVGWGDCLLYK